MLLEDAEEVYISQGGNFNSGIDNTEYHVNEYVILNTF